MAENRRIGDRYRLVELIGQGGMGEVYRGEDERLAGRVVAIKKLMLGSTRGLEKLKREGSFQAKVTDKRHVVDVYDLIEERDGVFIVMEFVEGGRSLEACIADAPVGGSGAVTIARANELLLQAARGLDAVHRADVIHGDMKARNLLLTADGTLKLGDFGLSQAVGNVRTVQLGTAQNTAPEVYEGRVDPASDIYSLGFTFYELYIGRDHFQRQFELQMTSSAVASWMRWHLDETRRATPAHVLVGDAPPEVSDLLVRMMDKQSSKRPTAGEVVSVLEALRRRSMSPSPSDAASNTQPLAVPEPAAEVPRSRVLLRLIVATAALALLVLTVKVLRQRSTLASLDEGMRSLGTEVELKVAETEQRSGQAIEAGTAAADQSAKSAVRTVSERIGAVETLLGNLGVRVSAADASLEQFTKSQVDSTQSLRQEIDALRSRPSAAPVDLAPLVARIEALEGLASRVEHQAAALEELTDKVDELKVASGREGSRALAPNPTEITNAGAALSPPPAQWQGWITDLASTISGTRWQAVQSLGATGDAAALPHLAPMLKDDDIFVRMAAARHLGGLGSVDAIPTLIDALEDEEAAVREAAIVSLKALIDQHYAGQVIAFDPHARDGDRARPVKAWRDWWEQALKERVAARMAWAEVLARDPDPKVVLDPEVVQRIRDTGLPWQVRDRVSRIEMLLVPGGTYKRGASPGDSEANADEKPAHMVTISSPFYLGRYEVMESEWKRVLDQVDEPVRLDLPHIEPYLDEIEHFLALVNGEPSGSAPERMRLPYEGEWEYACRAGSLGARYGRIDDVAWFDKGNNGLGLGTSNQQDQIARGMGAHNVGGKRANELGFYDMLGNAWEWCADWYGSYDDCRSGVLDPSGPSSGRDRVLRGGNWSWSARSCRASEREVASDVLANINYHAGTGFRVARTP